MLSYIYFLVLSFKVMPEGKILYFVNHAYSDTSISSVTPPNLFTALVN